MIGRIADELRAGEVVEVSRVVRKWDIAEFVSFWWRLGASTLALALTPPRKARCIPDSP